MRNFLRGRLLLVRICLLTSVSILVLIGILMIYFVGNPLETSPASDFTDSAGYWRKQVVFAVVGVGGFIGANLVNYRRLGAISHWLYAGVLILLVLLVISRYVVPLRFIPEINGAHCWIQVGKGFPAFQPSEFCKLAYILGLAWYLRYRSNYHSFRALIGPFILTLVPMALILIEPDLGTVMLMMPVLFTMLFMAGARTKHLLLIILLAVLVSPFLWLKMRPYQRARVSAVFLQNSWVRQKAEQSPALSKVLVGGEFTKRLWRDTGFHITRSKLAIASGGLTGQGFGRGDFTKYDFLPYRHNDFIFSVIAHQAGLLGCLAFLGLYIILVICGLEIAADNIDPFARLLAVGIVAMIVVQVLVNVGMTLGLMPITGLTLPFVSYGGSSLLVSMMAVGLLNNVGRCRPFTVAPKK